MREFCTFETSNLENEYDGRALYSGGQFMIADYPRMCRLAELLNKGWEVKSTAINPGYVGHRAVTYHFILERDRP